MDEQPGAASPRPADHDSAQGRPQLSQVDVTLEHLGHLCSRLEQAEQRFKQMTDECSTVLDGLVSVDRRHATALATLNDRLSDWCNIERKLLEESARRIERFERGVEHEWTALRRLHEEPITDLRDQADKLRLACLDAARLARQRLDAAEQAYAIQTADFERRMAEWTRRVLQTATGRELPGLTAGGGTPGQAGIAPPLSAHVEPWPLDGVAQLHQELRSGPQAAPRPHYVASTGTDSTPPSAQAPATEAGPRHAEDGAPASPSVTEESTQQEPPAGDEEIPDTRTSPPTGHSRRRARVVWALFAIVLGVVVFLIASYIDQMQHRLVELESKAREAARPAKPADPTLPAAPGESPVPDAQLVAQRAGIMVNILAAPDLLRYDLGGVGAARGAYGQVLWSRSHGMALTAMRLPAAAGKVYRVWVSSDGRTASAGVLGADGVGAARLIVPGPLTLPRPATIVVTLENSGAVDRPSGPVYLTRVPTS